MDLEQVLEGDLCVGKDLVMQLGDRSDGVIGIPVLTADGHVVEASYFYGESKPKNIIVISSQVGCPSKCSFCELGPERFIRNLSEGEMVDQVKLVLRQACEYGFGIENIRHKVTFANSGEPLLNDALDKAVDRISRITSASFKISTVFPDTPYAAGMFSALAKANYASDRRVQVQMQVSLISTDEEYRRKAAGIKVASHTTIREAAERWRDLNPPERGGRRVNLSLILADDVPVEVGDVKDVFPPDLFKFRFRDYVPTEHGTDNELVKIGASRMASIKKSFEDAGYEVDSHASPTSIERKFDIASNVFRREYLSLIKGP